MAIEFARVRYLTRSKGHNACRSAAYNARADVHCERTGERFFFAHRDPTLYHEVMLPRGADPMFRDPATLWNAAQAAEKRKDAQEAKELLLALPSDPELGPDDWRELARSFVDEHFVSKGLAAQIDIHTPHDGDVNVHAHILVTTRRIEGDRLSTHKARDLDPEVRSLKGRQIVTEADAWNQLWREFQNQYFERMGLALRVDETGFVAQRHEGPIRLRTVPAESKNRLAATEAVNTEAARDPAQILAKLTEHRATFSELDIERILRKYVSDRRERQEIRAAVLARPEVVALYDQATEAFVNRYTTQAVRAEELGVMASAQQIASSRQRVASEAPGAYRLDEQQETAFLKATGTDGLVVIEGLAGAGKSYSLSAIREAHEQAGWRVIGLAPTNVVAEGLRASGFRHGSTAHLELYWQDQPRQDRVARWDRRTAVIVDEAAMMDTRLYARIFQLAARTGAKVILAGDDRQLSSVARGGMFTELKQRHGSVIISKVRRQQEDWQRKASEDFAEGRIADGLRAYAERGHIHWSSEIDESRARLLSDWDHDNQERPGRNRFVYASTNAEVNRLNRAIHDIRLARRDLTNELEVDTIKGKLAIGTGERIQFHANDRKQGIFNGSIGTITRIAGYEISVETDTGRTIQFDTRTFRAYGLGYAGTVYRGQGKTQNDVYALYDSTYAWNARTAYVGLTRHTDRVELYTSRDLAQDEIDLGMHMTRKLNEEASLAWVTADDLRKHKERERNERSSTTNDDLRKLDLTAFARDRYGFTVQPDMTRPDHYDLTRQSGEGTDRLDVRKDAQGHWAWRDAHNHKEAGDIIDLAQRMGAPSSTAARSDIVAYEQEMRERPSPEPEQARSAVNEDVERQVNDVSSEAKPTRDTADTRDELRADATPTEDKDRHAVAHDDTEHTSQRRRDVETVRDREQALLGVISSKDPRVEEWLAARERDVADARAAGPEIAGAERIDTRTSAQRRYHDALAEHYDPQSPSASLAKASSAEAARFLDDQAALNERIAVEQDISRRDALLLRRDIEHAEHMAQAHDRVAELARATGASDLHEHEQLSATYHERARNASAEWRDREQPYPDLHQSQTPQSEQKHVADRDLQQERAAMQRLHFPDYAAKQHDYQIEWSDQEQTRAILTKGDEELRASRDKDGTWSYESRTASNDRGDILDFVARRGARTTAAAREEVRPELERVEQEFGRLDPAPQSERSLDRGQSRDDDDGPDRDPERRGRR